MAFGLKKGIYLIIVLALIAFSLQISADSDTAISTRVYCIYGAGVGGSACDSGDVAGDIATCTSASGAQCAEEGDIYCYATSVSECPGDVNLGPDPCDGSGVTQAGPLSIYNVDYDNDPIDCACIGGAWLENAVSCGGPGCVGGKCCGDDGVADDFGQVPGPGRSCCYDGSPLLDESSVASVLCENGQFFDCGNQVTMTGDVDIDAIHCEMQGSPSKYCDTATYTWITSAPVGCDCSTGDDCASGLCIEGSCENACASAFNGDRCSDDANAYTASASGICTRNQAGAWGCDKDEVADGGTHYYNDCYEVSSGAPTSIYACDRDVNPSFVAEGICTYSTGAIDANSVNCDIDEVCIDASNRYRSDCSYCGSTAEYACDLGGGITFGQDGICVSSGACDTGDVCFDGSQYHADCSSCSISTSAINSCDSAVDPGYMSDGYCGAGASCCTASAYDDSGTISCGCSNGGGQRCQSSITGVETGSWHTYADGICVVGSYCQTAEACLSSGMYHGSLSSCAEQDVCDSDIDNAGFSPDGIVFTRNGVTLCCRGTDDYQDALGGSDCCYQGQFWSNAYHIDTLLCHSGVFYDCNSQVVTSPDLDTNDVHCQQRGSYYCDSWNNRWTESIPSGCAGCTTGDDCSGGVCIEGSCYINCARTHNGLRCSDGLQLYENDGICARDIDDSWFCDKVGASFFGSDHFIDCTDSPGSGEICDSGSLAGGFFQDGQCVGSSCCTTEVANGDNCGCADIHTQYQTSCDSTVDAGIYAPDGLCVNDGTGIEDIDANCLTTGEVCLDSGRSFRLTAGCLNCGSGDDCDRSISGEDYVRDGYCCEDSCQLDGSVNEGGACCGQDALCSDAVYQLSCVSGTCRRDQGESCALNTQCSSGYCVDGYCCDSACDGTCERCDGGYQWSGPIMRELPDYQTIEGGLGGMDMTGNVLLFHLNWNASAGETGTNFFDASGNGNDGVCVDCPAYHPLGRLKGAAEFSGSGNYIEVASAPSLNFGTHDFTLSAWVNTIQSPAALWPLIIGKIDLTAPGGPISYMLWFHNSSDPGIVCLKVEYVGGDDTVCSDGLSINDGRWHHVTGVKNSTHLAVYIDGARIDAQTHSATSLDNDAPLRIGSNDGSSWSDYQGSIDEAAIWNRSLSDGEILDLYKRGQGTRGICSSVTQPLTDPDGDCEVSFDACDSQCTRSGPGGMCSGDGSYCSATGSFENVLSGYVCTGSGDLTPVSNIPGEYCYEDHDCSQGACTARRYYTSCDGAGSCRDSTDHVHAYEVQINAQTGFTLEDDCRTDGGTPCAADSFNDYRCSGELCGDFPEINHADSYCTAGTPSACTSQGAWKGWEQIISCGSTEKCETDLSTYAQCINPPPVSGPVTMGPDPVIRVNGGEIQTAIVTVTDECGYGNIEEISIHMSQNDLLTNQRGRFTAIDGITFFENTSGYGNNLVSLDTGVSFCTDSGSMYGGPGELTCTFGWTLDAGYGACGPLDGMDTSVFVRDKGGSVTAPEIDDWKMTLTKWDCDNQPTFGTMTGVDMNLATGDGYEIQSATITYTDIDGNDDLNTMRILVNWQSGGASSCSGPSDPNCGGYFMVSRTDMTGGTWSCQSRSGFWFCKHNEYGGDKAVLDASLSSISCVGNNCQVTYRWYYPGTGDDQFIIDMNDISRWVDDISDGWSNGWTNQVIGWNTTFSNVGAPCTAGDNCTSGTCVDTDNDGLLDTCVNQGLSDGDCGGNGGEPALGYNPYLCETGLGSTFGVCIYSGCIQVTDSDQGACFTGSEYRTDCSSCSDEDACDRTTTDGVWGVTGRCQGGTCCQNATASHPYLGDTCDSVTDCVSYCGGDYNESYHSGGDCSGGCVCTYSSTSGTDIDTDGYDDLCENFPGDSCSVQIEHDNCGNIFLGATNCAVAGNGTAGTIYCTNCPPVITRSDSTCNCGESADNDTACCDGLVEGPYSTDTIGECESSCGSHAGCDENMPYSCQEGIGWCYGTQGCQNLCTTEVVGTFAGDSSICGNQSSSCGCNAGTAGFSCDGNFDGLYGICADRNDVCCDYGSIAAVVEGEYQCGCDSGNQGYRCDSVVADQFSQDGLCASTDNGASYGCQTSGHVCFDDGFYESSCSYCSVSLDADPLGDNCTIVLDSGDYSPDGMCTAGGICTTSGSIYADTSDSRTLNVGCSDGTVEDLCMSIVGTIWEPDGICVSGNLCDTTEVCNNTATGILMDGCLSCEDGSLAMSTLANDGSGWQPDTICVGGTACNINYTETQNCGCTASDAMNAVRCDRIVTGLVTYDGVCAASNDVATEFDCVAGSVFYNGTYYFASRPADGRTDGKKCDADIGSEGFNWEGYGVSDGTCDTVGLTAQDCGETGDETCGFGDSFYTDCSITRSGQPDSCDTTIDSGEEFFVQQGTCYLDGDDISFCHQTGHLVDHQNGSFSKDCEGNAGAICDSSVLGGDYLADGICYDDSVISSGCCQDGQWASSNNMPYPEYCGTESQVCGVDWYNCSIVASQSFDPMYGVCDADDRVCETCDTVLGNDGMCEEVCGAAVQCDEFESAACRGIKYCDVSCAYITDQDSSQEVCNCQGGRGLAETCQDGQNDCWVLNISGTGGNCCEIGDDYCAAVGGCHDGTYHTDADSSSFICSTCAGAEWDASANAGLGQCCGDDGAEYWDADDHVSASRCCFSGTFLNASMTQDNYFCNNPGGGALLYRCGGEDVSGGVAYEASDCELIGSRYCDLDSQSWVTEIPLGCPCSAGLSCGNGVCVAGSCEDCSMTMNGQQCSDDDKAYTSDGICTRDAAGIWDCDEILASINSSVFYGTCSESRWNATCDSDSLAGGFSADGVCGGTDHTFCCTDHASGFADRPEICGTEIAVCSGPYDGHYCSSVAGGNWLSGTARCDADDNICDPCESGLLGLDGDCEKSCGAHVNCDEESGYSCSEGLGWCYGSQGCQSWCTSAVVGQGIGDPTVCNDSTSTCGCNAGTAGFTCDNNYDGIYGICTDEENLCCDNGSDAVNMSGQYQCGCDVDNQGYMCDDSVLIRFIQDGICASTDDGSVFSCVTSGHVCFDDTFYESSCSYCDISLDIDPSGDNCTTILTDGDYSPNGMCTSGGVCTTSGSIYADTDDSRILKTGCSDGSVIDICMSTVTTRWSPDGLCVAGGVCDTDEVCNSTSTQTLRASCAECPDGSPAMSSGANNGTGFNPDMVCSGGVACGEDYVEDGSCGCALAHISIPTRCDQDPGDGIDWNGVCTATDDGATAFACVNGSVFFDGIYYFSERKADGSTDGWKCDPDINSTGFIWKGYGISNGSCVISEVIARDCGSGMDISCQPGTLFYGECSVSRSGQPDSCDVTITTGNESWSQEGTCLGDGDLAIYCDTSGHIVSHINGSYLPDCQENPGQICDSSVLGGDFLADGICYDNGLAITGCCIDGNWSSSDNLPYPQYCGTEEEVCTGRNAYNCSIITSQSFDPSYGVCDADDVTCETCASVYGSDGMCEEVCGADIQCDEHGGNSCLGIKFCDSSCSYLTSQDQHQEVCNCQGGFALGSTCLDGQSDCWVINVTGTGGGCCEPGNLDNYCAAVGGCDAGVYLEDPDDSLFICTSCNGSEWNPSAGNGDGKCCGDDYGESWDTLNDAPGTTQCCLFGSLMDNASTDSNYYCYDDGSGARLSRCGGIDISGGIAFSAGACAYVGGMYCDLDNEIWIASIPVGCDCVTGSSCLEGTCINGTCTNCSADHSGIMCSDDGRPYNADGICTVNSTAHWDCDEEVAAIFGGLHYALCGDASWNATCDSDSLAGGFLSDGVCGTDDYITCCTAHASGALDRPEVCGTEAMVCSAPYDGHYCDAVNDGVWFSGTQRCDANSSICDPCSDGIFGLDGNCEWSCGAPYDSDEKTPDACHGTSGWTNASCTFFNEGDDNAETCACVPDMTPGDRGKAWAIGGSIAAETCCGDDPGEFMLVSNYSATLDNLTALPIAEACCTAENDCVNSSSHCLANGSAFSIDLDIDLDYCLEGTWVDCWDDSHCDAASGFYCTPSNECTDGCSLNSDCLEGFFCNQTGRCQTKLDDGEICISVTFEDTQFTDRKDSEDGACLSGYCDNDGVGDPDGGHCFSVLAYYYDSINSTCEYSINHTLMLPNADEKVPDACHGELGYTNASCVYFTDGDDNPETCACVPDLTLFDLGKGWNVGGSVSPTTCCGDDPDEFFIPANYSYTLDNATPYAYQDACCTAITDCVDPDSNCYYDGTSHEIDADGDLDYCDAGIWVDCFNNSHCDTGNGYSCTIDNDCRQHEPLNVDVHPYGGIIYAEYRIENFTTRHIDVEGYDNIEEVRLLINSNLDILEGTGEEIGFFYGSFDRTSDRFAIRSDDNSTWIDAGQIGSIAETCNAYACIEPGSTKHESGNILTVFWNIRFRGTWRENNASIYLYSEDAQGLTSGYTVAGSVRIENKIEIASAVCSDPSPHPGETINFTAAVYYNASNVPVDPAWFWCGAWVGNSLEQESTQNECHITSQGQATGCSFSIPYPDPHDNDHGFRIYCDGPDNGTAMKGENYDDSISVLCPTADVPPFGDNVTVFADTLYAGKSTTITIEARDPNGWDDIDYVAVRIDWQGDFGDLPDMVAPFMRWGLPVAQEFNETWDSGDRIWLSVPDSSYTHDGNDTIIVTFNFTPHWNFEEGRDGSVYSVYAEDGGGNNDPWETEPGQIAVISNLVNITCQADTDAAALGSVVNFTGYVHYNGTTEVPLDYELGKGLFISLMESGSMLGRDDTFNPDGFYNISYLLDRAGPVLEFKIVAWANESGRGSGLMNRSQNPPCIVTLASDMIGEFSISLGPSGADSLNISTSDLDYASGDSRDITLICAFEDDDPRSRSGHYNDSTGQPSSLSVIFDSLPTCTGENNTIYCSAEDPAYSSIFYRNQSKTVTFDPDDAQAYCSACGLTAWAIGGDIDPDACCGDDPGEYNLSRRYDEVSIEPIGYGPMQACCTQPDDCVQNESCYANHSSSIDFDYDGDRDYCLEGIWVDCYDNTHCDTDNGYYCTIANNCINTCMSNDNCSAGFFCDFTGTCQPQLDDGDICVGLTFEGTQFLDRKDSEDGACLSSYCDNDGVGDPDDGHCFSVNGTYYDNQNDACEISINSTLMLPNADEKIPDACHGTAGFTNASCYYFDDGDMNAETCACVEDLSLGDRGKAFAVGGEVSPDTCCGDDPDEWYLISNYSEKLDNTSAFPIVFACCLAQASCVSPFQECFADSATVDLDSDGDQDVCVSGKWMDCVTDLHCLPGYSCIENDCLDITPPEVIFVDPTPQHGERQVNNNFFINITVFDTASDIDSCWISWDNGSDAINLSMARVGSGTSVTCYLSIPTRDGTTYTYQAYANETSGEVGNTTLRSNRENAVPRYDLISVLNSSVHIGNLALLSLAVTDDDGDQVTIEFFGEVGNDPRASLQRSLASNYSWPTVDGIRYFWKANLSDGYEYNMTGIWNFYENAYPMTTAQILPLSPQSNDILYCVNSSLLDPEGHPVSIVGYSWRINNIDIGINHPYLGPGNTSQNNMVQCRIIISDTYENATYPSQVITILSDGPHFINSSAGEMVPAGELINFNIHFTDHLGTDSTLYICKEPTCLSCGPLNQEDCYCYDDVLASSPIGCSYETRYQDNHINNYWVQLIDDLGKSNIIWGTDRHFLVNHWPIIQTVRVGVTPTHLSCDPYGVYDKDNHSVHFEYAWYESDIPLDHHEQLLPKSFMKDDHYYRCGMIPIDEYGLRGMQVFFSPLFSLDNLAPEVRSAWSSEKANVTEDIEFHVEWFDLDSPTAALFICKDAGCVDCNFENDIGCYCTNRVFSSGPLACNHTAEGKDDFGPNNYWVRVYDGLLYSPTFLGGNTFIINHAPEIGDVALLPVRPILGDSLTCDAVITEPDGQSFSSTYEWYVDSVPLGINSSDLGGGNITTDSYVYCAIKATDEMAFTSNISYSEEIYLTSNIILSAYAIHEVNVSRNMTFDVTYTSHDDKNMTLFICKNQYCSGCDASDRGDCWCSTVVPEDSPLQCNFTALQTSPETNGPHNYWAMIYDGKGYSRIIPGNDTSFLINHYPEIDEPIVDPPMPGIHEDINCLISVVSDIDDDVVTLNYDWIRDGIPMGINNSVLGSGNTTKGEEWTCQVTPIDWHHLNGTTRTAWPVVVMNVPDLLDPPYLNATYQPLERAILCIGGTYFDADGEEKHRDEWRWYRNGNLINGETSDVLYLDRTRYIKGDFIHCEQRVQNAVSLLYSNWYFSSNTLMIANSPPEPPMLRLPTNDNHTLFYRNVSFLWFESEDNDNLLGTESFTYEIQIRQEGCFDPMGCTKTFLYYGGLNALRFNLQEYLDIDSPYNWTVRATDGENWSRWADEWTFTIQSTPSLKLINQDLFFGRLSVGFKRNTTMVDGPTPFLVMNDGNVHIDILSRLIRPFWGSTLAETLPNKYFITKAGIYGPKPLSFNISASQMTWIGVANTSSRIVGQLGFDPRRDVAEVDIGIEVPANEPVGEKNTTLELALELSIP